MKSLKRIAGVVVVAAGLAGADSHLQVSVVEALAGPASFLTVAGSAEKQGLHRRAPWNELQDVEEFGPGQVQLLSEVTMEGGPGEYEGVSEQWSATGWTPSGGLLLTFDDNGRLSEIRARELAGEEWVETLYADPAYRDGALSEVVLEMAESESSTFGDKLKAEVTYGADGTVSMIVMYLYDDETQSWVELVRTSYVYGAGGRPASETRSLYLLGLWVDLQTTIYTYDAAGNLTEKLTRMPSVGGVEGENISRVQYTNDAGGNAVEEISQEWGESDWENLERTLRAFDARGNPTEETSQAWDAAEVQWANQSKATTAYNAEDNPTETVRASWGAGTWNNSYKESYAYEPSLGLPSFIPATSRSWKWENAEWAKSERMVLSRIDARAAYPRAVDRDQGVLSLEIRSQADGWVSFAVDAPAGERVSLSVYDLRGTEVASVLRREQVDNGRVTVRRQAGRHARGGGVYPCVLRWGNRTATALLRTAR